MNWTEEPATMNQLAHLRQFGYEPDRRLTKREALHMIRDFEEHPEPQTLWAEKGVRSSTKDEAYRLRAEVENARRAIADAGGAGVEHARVALPGTMAKRQDFWMDTCREPKEMRACSAQVLDLYMKHGCRFTAPGREQVQVVLDALDSVMPRWENDHPELFYQTLELNFRECLRRVL